MNTEADRIRHRVAKTLSPSDRGAKGLAERYGDTLVCVRHRVDETRRVRFVTVELVVERKRIKPRSDKMVRVHLEPHERQLRSLALKAGAQWDAERKLWLMPKRIAEAFSMLDRIVEM